MWTLSTAVRRPSSSSSAFSEERDRKEKRSSLFAVVNLTSLIYALPLFVTASCRYDSESSSFHRLAFSHVLLESRFFEEFPVSERGVCGSLVILAFLSCLPYSPKRLIESQIVLIGSGRGWDPFFS